MLALALALANALGPHSAGAYPLNLDAFGLISRFISDLINSILGHVPAAQTSSTTAPPRTARATSTSVAQTTSTVRPTTVTQSATSTIPPKANAHANSTYTGNFIVSNPVNLSQINFITKFRSCYGHDLPGLVNGSTEPKSSKRHYFSPFGAYSAHASLYAPFNGTVTSITIDVDGGEDIYMISPNSGNWLFGILHMAPAQGIAANTSVHAGQLIGHSDVPSGDSIDVDLLMPQPSQMAYFLHPQSHNMSQASANSSAIATFYNSSYDSIFNHMEPATYEQYNATGVNRSDIIIPREYRLANPCTCKGADAQKCYFVGAAVPGSQDAVTLAHRP